MNTVDLGFQQWFGWTKNYFLLLGACSINTCKCKEQEQRLFSLESG